MQHVYHWDANRGKFSLRAFFCEDIVAQLLLIKGRH